MLARLPLPSAYEDWNRHHRAPSGPGWWSRALRSRAHGVLSKRRFDLPGPLMRLIGPFGFQENSATRSFEFPWAWMTLGPRPGMRVVDVGAGASGLQFALANAGVDVTSVDPLLNPDETVDWVFSQREYDRLNRAFGGRVRFIRNYLQNSGLAAGSFDAVLSVSVIEHIPDEHLPSLMREIARLLRPGGRFIATIDLFLDCAPFTATLANHWGSNRDIRAIVEASGMEIAVGLRAELYGFPEFNPQAILEQADSFVRSGPVLTQLLVLEKVT